MTTSSHDADRLCWTALGVRMGFTSGQPQREEILDAIDRMTWVQTPARPPYLASLDGQAVRAIVTAVVHHGRDQLHMVGSAQLDGGRQLIGLDDGLGTRSYVLDLDLEAIYVLAGFTHARTAHVA